MKTISLKFYDHVAEVTLNRPAQSNALNLDCFHEIIDAGEQLIANTEVRSVILSGNGKHFCAGLDKSMFPKNETDHEWFASLAQKTYGPSDANIFQRTALIWREIPVPVIAAIQGAAFGGGCQIALGADIRVADTNSQFSLRESHWGLIPDMAVSKTLPPLVRADLAAELIYTSAIIDAEKAQQIGLVTTVSDNYRETAFALAKQIALKSPQAIRAAKKLSLSAWDSRNQDLLQLESKLQMELFGSKEQLECVRANIENRLQVFE